MQHFRLLEKGKLREFLLTTKMLTILLELVYKNTVELG
jgi:hypothetical protein